MRWLEENHQIYADSVYLSSQQIHDQVLDNVEHAQKSQTEQYQKCASKGHKIFNLKPGDLVLQKYMKNIGKNGDRMAQK